MAITPLFAIEAQNLLNDGKVQEAIDLCKEGLIAFPNYAAGEGVLARAYKMIGDESKAEQTLNSAITRNPFNKGLKSIKKQKLKIPDFKIEPPKPKSPDEIEKEKKLLKEAPELEIDEEMKEFNGDSEEKIEAINEESDEDVVDIEDEILDTEEFIDEDLDEDILIEEDEDLLGSEELKSLDENEEVLQLDDEADEFLELDVEDPDLIPGLIKLTIENNINFSKEEFELIIESNIPDEGNVIELVEAKKKTEVKDEVEELAKNLDGAKILPSEDSFPKPEIVEEEIITPTIAEILVEQGAYNEAIDAFKSLKKLHPEKEKEFKKRIKEIKKLI